MKQIAIQGIKGSFHDIAAHQYFDQENLNLILCTKFEDIFKEMEKNPEVLGFMAIENTIAGSLLHNYELLRDSGMTIVGEYKLHIEHSIMCLPDDDASQIAEVNSHPVALMQCRKFLEKYPDVKVVEADDTAGAAEMISRKQLHGHAAICHAGAAEIYGMKVLENGIEDNKHNYTRFLVLAHPDNSHIHRDLQKSNKSSMVFALPHEVGSLSHVLSIFAFYKINLTKIQSLPIIGREWQYLFYADLSYDDYTRYCQSVDAIRPLLRELKILGEYEGA